MDYSPASSSRSSPVHPASLVDPATHSPALMQLIDIKINRPVIEYVVDCVSETVDYAMGRSSPPRGRASTRRPELQKFTTFVTNVLTRAEVTTPVVLASLVYIDRAKPHLHIALEEWALERVFLGALIVASKYLNDSTLKNVHWALCTGVFGKRDVGRIEREFLDVLDWELQITEDDLLSHHAGLSAAAFPHQQPAFSPRHTTFAASRNHHRSSADVPELEPCSSPHSSDSSSSSSSPQTPSSLDASSPESYPRKSSRHTPKKSSGSFHDLIRSFPIPHPGRHHHQQHTQNQFPIHV
ncbi:hypothetical protein VNI00_014155 [Paramarasmius palmivorus]|uniref:Cyclin N-terminal domain-containing protein n=1 Tax=Paramarasmius palmivorus TaxID=297713 RepID=A0AAW0BWD8_9AGAR